ncbi:MAG: hypothetical protein SOW59_09420 [Corynebacterium sp.]|nr:hypothetical protein [Corynebacterium sp.]
MLGNDRGSVSVEAALALSSLVVVAAAIVSAVATLAAYVSAIDTAGAAARAYAIGIPFHPAREDVGVDLSTADGLITARARVPAPIGTMEATAVFPAEIAGQEVTP